MQERQLQAGVWRVLILRTLVFGFGMAENMSKKRQKLQEWASCALEVWLVTK